MKRKIDVSAYAEQLNNAIGKGILLNTKGEKFNTMIIGWGHLGRLWNLPTYNVYVRESRYTKPVLDCTGVFTVSVPLKEGDPKILKVCGSQSGRDMDKAQELGLTLEEAEVNGVPGIKEYPLTLECRVLYQQDQDISKIPEEIVKRFYPDGAPGTTTPDGKDLHTMYVGEIVAAYIIE